MSSDLNTDDPRAGWNPVHRFLGSEDVLSVLGAAGALVFIWLLGTLAELSRKAGW